MDMFEDISEAGTGTGTGKIIEKQAEIRRFSQNLKNSKYAIRTFWDIVNSRKRRVTPARVARSVGREAARTMGNKGFLLYAHVR